MWVLTSAVFVAIDRLAPITFFMLAVWHCEDGVQSDESRGEAQGRQGSTFQATRLGGLSPPPHGPASHLHAPL